MEQKLFDPDGVGVDNGNYFGLPFTPDQARLVLISAPWDVTVSYGAGPAYGPDAIIEASTQLDFHDPLAAGAWREGIATAEIDYSLQELSQRLRGDAERVIEHLEAGGAADDDHIQRKLRRVNEGCEEMNRTVEAQAERWLSEGKIVGLVGGDHSTPYGLISALGRRHESFGILHIDAHRDLRDCYEGFSYSHASIMHNVLRDIPAVGRLVQVAVRDFSATELRTAENDPRVESFTDLDLATAGFAGTTWHEQCRRIVDTLPEKVYVSFDIDGLSPDLCPHTGTPVPGGLTFNKAVHLIHVIAESGRRIIGFDVVEVAPAAGTAAATERIDAIVGARILWMMCGQTLISNKAK